MITLWPPIAESRASPVTARSSLNIQVRKLLLDLHIIHGVLNITACLGVIFVDMGGNKADMGQV